MHGRGPRPIKRAADEPRLIRFLEEELGKTSVLTPGHASHVAAFVQHMVANAFAHYGFPLPSGCTARLWRAVAVHPNTGLRERTGIAGDVVKAMSVTPAPFTESVQIFALIVWRWHNTAAAWEELREPLLVFAKTFSVHHLRHAIQRIYGKSSSLSYMFSTADGRRGGGSAWQASVLNSLDQWWAGAQLIVCTMAREGMSPEMFFFAEFHTRIAKALPNWGPAYWLQFIFGDLGRWGRPDLVELSNYTIVGTGCIQLFQSWGFPPQVSSPW